jgi:chromosome segregation ATPase
MKNYLFRPFQNDNEKEDVFKEYQDNHKHLDNSQVIGFICRLESTYDVIISKLESDNSSFHGQYDEIQELKAEIKELQVENIKLNSECWCGCNDDLRAEYMELINDNKELKAEVEEGRDAMRRLMEQVSSNRGNSSSTHTHTIEKEIDDYLHHNPKCKMVKLFILPCEEFDEDGEYEGGCLYWDDGIV